MRQLFASYGDRVYALDHPTLGASPIANALTLVRALPAGARVHLVTHSRGGLVAEVLARACGDAPLGDDVLALFAGDDYAEHRSDLRALVERGAGEGIRGRARRARRAARRAARCSRRSGSTPTCRSSSGASSWRASRSCPSWSTSCTRSRGGAPIPSELPGLAAMMPDSPLVALAATARPTPIPGELRVVAGDMEGDSVGSWVKTLLSDAFYWTDNDLVVQTRSMYGGAPRASGDGSGARFLLDQRRQGLALQLLQQRRAPPQAIVDALIDDAPADFAADRPAVVGRRGRERHACRARGRALARRRRRGRRADRPAVFVLPGHPRLQPEGATASASGSACASSTA